MADTLSLLLSFSCGNYFPLPLHPGCLFVPPNSLSDVYMQLGSFFYLHVIVYASFSFSTHLLLPPCAYLHTPFLLSALHIPLP